jgi:hypothetical protein
MKDGGDTILFIHFTKSFELYERGPNAMGMFCCPAIKNIYTSAHPS